MFSFGIFFLLLTLQEVVILFCFETFEILSFTHPLEVVILFDPEISKTKVIITKHTLYLSFVFFKRNTSSNYRCSMVWNRLPIHTFQPKGPNPCLRCYFVRFFPVRSELSFIRLSYVGHNLSQNQVPNSKHP